MGWVGTRLLIMFELELRLNLWPLGSWQKVMRWWRVVRAGHERKLGLEWKKGCCRTLAI